MCPRPIPDPGPRPGDPIERIPGGPGGPQLPPRPISIWRSACNFRVEHYHYESEDTTHALKEKPQGGTYMIGVLSNNPTDVDIYMDLCLPPNSTIKRVNFYYKTDGECKISEVNLTIFGDGSYSAFTDTNLSSPTKVKFISRDLNVNFAGAAVLSLNLALKGHGNYIHIDQVQIVIENSQG